jgi:hypothetical protein
MKPKRPRPGFDRVIRGVAATDLRKGRVLSPDEIREKYGPRRPGARGAVEQTVTVTKASVKTPAEPAPEPTAAASPIPVRRRGGRPCEYDWEGAAGHVDDDIVKKKKPLPRNERGEPIIQRAIDLMQDWFKSNQKAVPTNIRRWINNNSSRTCGWWGEDE